MIDPVESFRLCPTPGCVVLVWGPTRTENRCRAHGGNALRFPELLESDEWGEPQTATPDVPSHAGGSPQHSEAA